MSFMPYLHFDGTCARAMAFYRDVFDGTDLQTMLYRDAPEAVPDWKNSDRVIHSQLTAGGAVLMASDYPPGQGTPQAAVSIMHTARDMAHGAALCDRLAEGGAVIMPFGKTFFSPGFGMVKDRFGTHWMIGVTGDDADH